MSKKKFTAKQLAWAKHIAALPLNAQHPPPGAVLADHDELKHINTYGELPPYYVDKPFVCRDCAAEEIWTGEQQKWWYEVAKGHIDSTAVRCRECRNRRKQK